MAHKYVEKFYNHQYLFDQFLNNKEQRKNLYKALEALKQLHIERNVAVYDALNDQTAGMIEIAEKVTSIYDKIETMNISTAQLKEECKVLKERCDTVASTFHTCCTSWLLTNDIERGRMSVLSFNNMYPYLKVDANAKITETKNTPIDTNIEIERLERLVYDYSMQTTYLHIINNGLPSEVKHNVEDNNSSNIAFENSILAVLNNKFIEAYKSDEKTVLKQCLVMYDLLNKHKECEELFIKKFVVPHLLLIFNEQRLSDSKDNIDILYQDALDFINVDMQTIASILKENPEIRRFNFILHCFWYEAHKMIENNLPLLTSAGNPELFHKRYIETLKFLKSIASMCNVKDVFYTDPTFTDHMKMFDINVYYEIRHQKIAGILEKDILQRSSISPATFCFDDGSGDTDYKFYLHVTKTLWYLLQMCFDTDRHVFLQPLTEQFLRLSILLISRYVHWISDMITHHGGSTDENWEIFLIYAISDITLIRNKICGNQNVNESIYKNLDLLDKPEIESIIKLNNSKLNKIFNFVKTEIIDIKIKESGSYLNEVTSIPRLYRRTNKSAPKGNSTYIAQTTTKVLAFNNAHQKVLKESTHEIVDGIIVKLTGQYLHLVVDVINSVCKTEKSLRRLKNRYSAPGSLDDSQSNVNTDEAKIREQIKLDVTFLINEMSPIAHSEGKMALNKLADSWSGN